MKRHLKGGFTVQHYLKTLDRDRLEDQFFSMYPIHYEKWAKSEENRVFPVGAVREFEHERFRNFVDKLCELTPSVGEDGKTGCIYSYRFLDVQDERSLDTDLFFPEDGVDGPGIAYEFQEPEVIVGYLVADTPLTQLNIYETIANVLYEASFFGYDEDSNKQERDRILSGLQEAKKEIEAYREESHRDQEEKTSPTMSFSKLEEETETRGRDVFINTLKTMAAESPKEQKLRAQAEGVLLEYSQYSRKRERAEVLRRWGKEDQPGQSTENGTNHTIQ